MKLLIASVIYNATSNHYVGNEGVTITLNCERLSDFSPRPAYLLRYLAPGDGTNIITLLTEQLTSADVAAYGANIVQGYLISQDDQDVLIDLASAQVLDDACNACCDDSVPSPLTKFYTSGIPAFTNPTISDYCVARVDDGGAYAHQKVALDYFGAFGVTGFVVSSHNSGVTYYNVKSALSFIAIGTDAVTAGVCARQ